MLTNFLVSLFGFLLAIGILVAVHEFGHFWVARRFGVKVLRFSIGFGRPFFRWYDKLGTEYVLSSIPLGGYVALFGERGGDIPESERHLAFANKPVWVRIAILLAGPFFNFGFAIFAYWLMFIIGISSLAPILGPIPSKSPADLAGLRPNQEIISIEQQPTPSWQAISVALLSEVGENKPVAIEVKDRASGTIQTHQLDLSAVEHSDSSDLLKDLGLTPLDPLPPVIGNVLPGYPASEAGMLAGDKIIAINGRPIHSRTEARDLIQPKIGETLILTIVRGDQKREISLQPVAKKGDDGKTTGFIGVLYKTDSGLPKEWIRKERFGPIKALQEASLRTVKYIILTFEMLKKMLLGKLSMKHLSGPISIAQYAGQTVIIGLEYFLNFLAVVSISLGVFNLLPIPLLDGGHILYCVFELITGRPVSEQIQNIGLWIGGFVILLLMFFALYNDLARF